MSERVTNRKAAMKELDYSMFISLF